MLQSDLYFLFYFAVHVKYLQLVESMRQESVHLSWPKDLRKDTDNYFDKLMIV